MSKARFKIVPSSYLILIKNGRILLSRRSNTGFMDGFYGLVAGHMESGEGFTKAIIREAKEEANIIVKPRALRVIHVMNRFEKQNNVDLQERIDVFIAAKKWHGQIKIMEPEKCDDLNWFALDKLPTNTIPYIKQAVRCIRKKIFYSEFGYKKIYK